MAQVSLLADGDDLLDELVHLGHLGHIVGGEVGAEHHQIHGLDTDAVMLFEHVAIEVLLDAIMIERSIGQTDTVLTHLATKALDDGLALGVDHLRRALPVVDGELAIVFLANQVDLLSYLFKICVCSAVSTLS